MTLLCASTGFYAMDALHLLIFLAVSLKKIKFFSPLQYNILLSLHSRLLSSQGRKGEGRGGGGAGGGDFMICKSHSGEEGRRRKEEGKKDLTEAQTREEEELFSGGKKYYTQTEQRKKKKSWKLCSGVQSLSLSLSGPLEWHRQGNQCVGKKTFRA